MEILSVTTHARSEMHSITAALADAVRKNGWEDGMLLVFTPHTTASITINESYDDDVRSDMTGYMDGAVPRLREFRHAEGNSDAHIKSSLFTPHTLLIVEQGKIRLGTWQGVYFCEWDGPREREVWLKFMRS